MCNTKTKKKSKTKVQKQLRESTPKSLFCFCNCIPCGFDRHCGTAGCYFSVDGKL